MPSAIQTIVKKELQFMIRLVTQLDLSEWIVLAKEVEPLFGEMVNNPDFIRGIQKCISNFSALCIEDADNNIAGIIAFNKAKNEIAWLAVKNAYRSKGYGHQLLSAAIEQLDTQKPIYVQTFASDVTSGESARKLYTKFGFKDDKDAGKNPAGIDTIIMKLGQFGKDRG